MFEIREPDILVIGGGGAGMRAAIAAAELGKNVLLLSKGPLSRTGITPVAGEGVEGAVNDGDSPELHYSDTVSAGRGLADEPLVHALAADSVARIRDLESYGAKFKKKDDGSYATSLRPGQTHSRNLYILGGGYGLAANLLRRIGELPNILVLEDVVVTKILAAAGRVAGVVYLDVRSGEVHVVRAKATILATGGYEELWPFTDTPPDTTGESLAMVYQLGVQLVDLEQVLYYPGVVVHPPAARGWLVQYEYLLNPEMLDGRVLNGKGEEFVQGFPARDEFIRAIRIQAQKGDASPRGGFYVDLSKSRYSREELTSKLETWLHQFNNLKQVGIDIRDDKLEMAPAAHYCLGGVKIDPVGRTNLEGLFAAGEITGNVHGANRVSGNALSETQVFGKRAAEEACAYADSLAGGSPAPGREELRQDVLAEYTAIGNWKENKQGALRPSEIKTRLQVVMDKYMGLEREAESLTQGLAAVKELQAKALPLMAVNHCRHFCYEVQEAYEVKGMIELAELVILSALARKESRGHHFRLDYPQTNPVPQHTAIRFVEGQHQIGLLPVAKR
ncbi:MAG: FAD-binding protein [Negativicutes bacterium]|nr:FAD-binding protein [Negativicutes bacterium]